MPNDSFDYTVLPERLCRLPFLFGVLRNRIREDERVSTFRNFFINLSAELFSFFVFDTVQSEGTNKLKSRM